MNKINIKFTEWWRNRDAHLWATDYMNYIQSSWCLGKLTIATLNVVRAIEKYSKLITCNKWRKHTIAKTHAGIESCSFCKFIKLKGN